MKRLLVDHGAASDVGLVREVNEDSFFAEAPVYVVADGMGGHDGGDVASNLAVEEFARLAGRGLTLEEGVEAIAEALRSADARIGEYAAGQRARGHEDFHSGTTVAAAVVVEAPAGPQWLLANLGDSRIYRFFEGALTQVSVDHSLVQELVDAGTLTPEQAERHPDRHVVTRALGGVASAVPDLFHMMLPPGSRLLLCSDGVSGMIGAAAMAAILDAPGDARDAARRLVDAAVAAGGRDNATAVVVDVVGWADESPYDAVVQRQSLEQKLGVLP
ncbi:protein phosphatase 2C domain-containing protein [Nocardioides sp. BP30]|uniref:PP2C family protein-serine/threonine phosphatase n=1 Tax=Nocardioides sp. BP30 TaxID=3036374 RepID=UPI0024696701|nr:protein phosphatase 2C domain-containing protein [Nocardioides sp. BP30]WGL53169.1 protein phosphatase 2C domain-containing protein [Nocardioides sp. BP30]